MQFENHKEIKDVSSATLEYVSDARWSGRNPEERWRLWLRVLIHIAVIVIGGVIITNSIVAFKRSLIYHCFNRRLRVDHCKGFYAPNQKKKEGDTPEEGYKPSGAEGVLRLACLNMTMIGKLLSFHIWTISFAVWCFQQLYLFPTQSGSWKSSIFILQAFCM